MPSDLPAILADHITQLQTALQGAEGADGAAFQATTTASLDAILDHVEVTPTIQRAADQVRSECLDLADELQAAQRAKEAIARHHEAAVDALDILENVLRRAEPSAHARQLGHGW